MWALANNKVDHRQRAGVVVQGLAELAPLVGIIASPALLKLQGGVGRVASASQYTSCPTELCMPHMCQLPRHVWRHGADCL